MLARQVTFTSMVEIAEVAPDFLLLPSYISRHLLYLAGPLQAAPKKAAAKNDAKVDVLGKHRDSKTGKLYVRYRYTGSSRSACPSTSTRCGSARTTIASAGATSIAWPTSGLR